MPFVECPLCGEFYRSRSNDTCPRCGGNENDKKSQASGAKKQMLRPAGKISLRSGILGKILAGLTCCGVILNAFALVALTAAAISFNTLTHTAPALEVRDTAAAIGYGITLLLMPIWLTLVLIDLRRLDPGYEVGTTKSLLRIWLPIYNLWGIMMTVRDLAEYFKGCGGEIRRLGSRLQFWLLAIYVSAVVLFYLPNSFGALIGGSIVSKIILLVHQAWNVGLVVITFMLVVHTGRALRLSVDREKERAAAEVV